MMGDIFYILLLGYIVLGTKVLKTVLANVPRCFIVQEKEIIDVPFQTPTFLLDANKTQCQVHTEDKKMLKCGQTKIYLKPECVCSFYNVFEAKYHGYSSCPDGVDADIVTQLKCQDCKEYSLNNNGPCINGGKLICKGEEVAPEVTCQCLPNYEGRLCENRIENVTRICDRISNSSSPDLPNCDITARECVTYSRNKTYAYRCRETYVTQKRRGLPPCLDTENVIPIPTDVSSVDPDQTEPGNPLSKAAKIQFEDIFPVAFLALVFQHFV